ncbi:MAG: hypothetical protein WBZ29_01495 [Methanocella sp.]
MYTKYTGALVSGVVFGILIGMTAALICLLPVSFILMVIAGAVTVLIAREDIKNATDAMISSGIAGMISGVVGTAVATVGLSLVVYLSRYINYEPFTLRELARGGIYGLVCAPVLIVSGVLLAAIGGYIYYEFVAKRKA